MKTLKALSALLTYPTADLSAAIGEIRLALDAENLLGPAQRQAMETLLAELASGDLLDLQERYVLLFDRTRSLSLHLFEHVHGESRDRGQAMADLMRVYGQSGLEIASTELPDFLPLLLEYCSVQGESEWRSLLVETVHVLTALGERLRKKGSAYAAVFEALVQLAAADPTTEALEAIVADVDGDPDDLEALDAVWEEEEVRFGPGAAAPECGLGSLAARIRQARRPAPGFEIPPTRDPRAAFVHVSSRS